MSGCCNLGLMESAGTSTSGNTVELHNASSQSVSCFEPAKKSTPVTS